MATLDFKLHDKQLEILKSDARFKICAAGRRGGKTYLSAVMLLIEGLKDKNEHGYDLHDKRVFYVAPTFDQGKRIIWDLLNHLGREVIKSTLENTAVITLVNGRKIEIKGADRPDTLRGVGLSYVVMDEYAFMKEEVWDKILRPTLSDVMGDALFIGTPEGKNHFYDLFIQAGEDTTGEMAAFTFASIDNPTINPKEIAAARAKLSNAVFKQEYEASFSASGGIIFDEKYFEYMDVEPSEGSWYIAVDPAGYTELETVTGTSSNLDECAIAAVKVGPYGWYVGDVQHGRWGVRETATRILRLAQKRQALTVGIEKGALKAAMMPFLYDEMTRLGTFPHIAEVTHGGVKKTNRITWALQGRFEHGRMYFRADADFIRPLETQLLDFPNPLSHDDLIDALAYVDQLATTDWEPDDDPDEWEDLDFNNGASSVTGY